MDEDDESLKLPLDQQWSHTKWSTRNHAYKAVAEQFASAAPGDPCFSTWAPKLKSAATDSNVIAMESGLKAISAFANNADPAEVEAIRPGILAGASEKALGAAKPSMKTTFQTLCQDLVAGSATPGAIIEELVPTLTLKSPKAVTAATINIRELFVNFGKVLPLKPVLTALATLFAHNDKNVRAEAVNLAVVLSQVAGQPVVEAALQGIKPVQLKDLLPKLQSAEPIKPLQIPRVMQQQHEADHGGSDGPDGPDGSNEPEELDPYDMADEINLKSKLPDISEAVVSVKWKERKEALESVEEKFNGVLRIAPEDYGALASQLAKVIQKDANLMCVTSATNTAKMLASGLRAKFSPYTATLLPPLMDRFKEKKAGVLEATINAVDAIYHAVGFDTLMPYVTASLAHKVPQARVESSKFLLRILSEMPRAPPAAQVKELTPAVVKNMSDSQEPVRAEAAKILAVLVKLVDKVMNPALAQLDDLRRQKVTDAAEHVSIKARPGKPAAPTASAASAAQKPAAARAPAKAAAPGRAAPSVAPAAPARSAAPRAASPQRQRLASPVKQPRPLHSTDFTPVKQSDAMRRRLGSPEKTGLPTVASAGARSRSPAKIPREAPREVLEVPLEPQAQSSPESRHSPTRGPLATIETDMLKREKMLAIKERDMIQKQLDQERVLRETAERQVMALREEIGRLKRELNNASKSANTSTDGSNSSLDNLNQRMSTMSIRDDSFERLSSRPITLGAPRTVSRAHQAEDQQRSGQVEKSHENWRRAKEVTSELRKRVEEMKRSRMMHQAD